MGTPTVAPKFKLNQNNGTAPIDLDTDDIRIFILTNTFTWNDAYDFVDDLTNHVTGTGAPGTSGLAVANKTLTLNGSNNAIFAHDDVVIAQSASGFTNGRWVVWAKWTGTASTSPIIQRMQETADFGNVDGPLTFDGSPTTGVLAIQ